MPRRRGASVTSAQDSGSRLTPALVQREEE